MGGRWRRGGAARGVGEGVMDAGPAEGRRENEGDLHSYGGGDGDGWADKK